MSICGPPFGHTTANCACENKGAFSVLRARAAYPSQTAVDVDSIRLPVTLLEYGWLRGLDDDKPPLFPLKFQDKENRSYRYQVGSHSTVGQKWQEVFHNFSPGTVFQQHEHPFQNRTNYLE